jgi:drug/metabolite transporter (DMT)-like permease
VSYSSGAVSSSAAGALAIAGACAAWGLDNNLTRLLSRRDPVRLVRIKTLGAGGCNLLLAAAIGDRFHHVPVGATLLVGFFCYGLSIVFDVLALRYLGAAREAAFFATAPFIGAVVAVPLLGDPLRPLDIVGGLLMATGMMMFLTTAHVQP